MMLGRWAAVIAALMVAGCGHMETVLSLQEVNCGSCGGAVEEALERKPGVRDARYQLRTAEVHVSHTDEVSPEALLATLLDAGYLAVLGPGKGTYLPAEEFPPGADVTWLTKTGDEVDMDQAKVPGKVTVVDFGAIWCAPCRKVDAAMAEVLQANPKVALRKIDVGDWGSPVVRQHMSDVRELPYVVVFGPDGSLVDRVEGLDLDRLRAAIERAGQ